MTREKNKSVWIDNALTAHDLDLTTPERIELLGKLYDCAWLAGAASQAAVHSERMENLFNRLTS